MEQKLFTEVIPLYRLHKDNPYAIRVRMRMQDDVDPVVLRRQWMPRWSGIRIFA